MQYIVGGLMGFICEKAWDPTSCQAAKKLSGTNKEWCVQRKKYIYEQDCLKFYQHGRKKWSRDCLR